MFRHFDRRRSVFVKLLISLFLVFFVATLIVGIINYFSVQSTITAQTYGHNLETLRQTSRIIETVLDSTERMAVRLAQNRTVQSVTLADWSLIGDHYPALRQVRAMIDDEMSSSPYIHSVYLVSPVNDRVLSVSGILRSADYVDISLLETARKDPTVSAWLGPRTTTRIDGRTTNVITLLIDIPVGQLEFRGLLVVNLDEKLFYDTVVRRNQRGDGRLTILNEASVVLSIDDKSLLTERMTLAEIYPDLEGTQEGYAIVRTEAGRYFVSLITSDYNRWIYVSATPYDRAAAVSRRVLLVSVGVSVLFLTLGLGLSFIVSKRFYRPIQSLVALIGAPSPRNKTASVPTDSDQQNDEFELIYASVDTLLRENRHFQARYAATDAILREHFLIDLLLGRTAERDNVHQEAAGFGLSLDASGFTVIVLRIVADSQSRSRDHEGMREMRYRVYEIASGVLNRYARGFVVDLGKTDVVLGVLCDCVQPLELCRTIASKLHDVITADLGIGTSYGIGSPERSPQALNTSYDHAVLALEYAVPSESGAIVAMDDVVADAQIHSTILGFRRGIDEVLQTFRRQEYDRAIAAAGELMTAVLSDRRLGRLHSTMLLHELLSAFLSLLVSFELDLNAVYGEGVHLFHDFAVQKTPEEARTWVLECIRTAAQQLSNRSSIRRRDFVGRIETFIAERYVDPIGLNDAAEHVYMNRQYFCSVFKTAFGTTFGEYLAAHRIERAVEVLESTAKPVNQIASEVGFTSVRSFVRVFRSVKGTTPTKYRLARQLGRDDPEKTPINGRSVTEFTNT